MAAVSKLRSPAATRATTLELGVSPRLASLVAPVELGTAALFVVRPSIGAAFAVALLVTFTVVLGRVVRSGRMVRCGCFGATTAAPVNSLTLMRNAALTLASVVAGFASSFAGASGDELAASALVGLGLISTGLLLHALAELGRTTGSVFAHPGPET